MNSLKGVFMDYYFITQEIHGKSCFCCQAINWNVDAFIADEDTGYIVQAYKRRQIPDKVINIDEYRDISYFEAWKVYNCNIIDEDKGGTCNDAFCIGHPMSPFGQFALSINTKGRFEFDGVVYWISKSNKAYEIVDDWSRTSVKQANGLKASFWFDEIKKMQPVTVRPTFIHEWDLSDEDKIYNSVKDIIFRYCPKNTKRDQNLLREAVDELLPDSYSQIRQRVIDEWKSQWI